jgi:hypothetical protein
LAARRKETFDGVYNIHINQMLYPQNTQPTRCKWEEVQYDEEGNIISPIPGSTTSSFYQGSNDAPSRPVVISGPFSHAPISDSLDDTSAATLDSASSGDQHGKGGAVTNGVVNGTATNGTTIAKDSIFSPVPEAVRRNVMVVDVHYANPPQTISHGTVSFYKGHRLRDTPDDVVDLLPEQCRKDFDAAREVEDNYDRQWGLERTDAHRRNPFYGFAFS